MSQSSPSSLPQPAAASRRPSRNTKLFMLVLVVLVLGVVVFFTRSSLRNAAADIEDSYARTMTPQAQAKVAQLTIWFGTLKEQNRRFADADPLRLFASEAEVSNILPERLYKLSRQNDADRIESAGMMEPDAATPESENGTANENENTLDETSEPTDGAENTMLAASHEPDETEQLGTQARLMLRQLQEYARTNSMSFVALYNTQGQTYLSTMETAGADNSDDKANFDGAANLEADMQLSSTTQEAMLSVVTSGEERLLPAYVNADGMLIMDIILPVYAPLYVDDSGTKIVGALVLGLNITQQVKMMTYIADPDASTPDSSRILQSINNYFEILHSDGKQPTPLTEWTVPAQGQPLPLALRRFTPPAQGASKKEDMYYTLALPVPGTPLYVEQDIPQHSAQTQYDAFQNTVLLAAALFSLVGGLLLVMLWWWFVGRSERAVSEELRNLYDTVTRQKQIIDGVNTSISDAIALTDEAGNFLYANLSFIRLAGETPQTIGLRNTSTLAFPTLGQNVQNHMNMVQRSLSAQTFMDELHVNGTRCYYQIACSPFHDENKIMRGMVSVYRDITALIMAQERAQHMVNQTIHVFVRSIEAVDPYLCGQSQLTGFLATSLAHCVGLHSHDVTLNTAANLSQIGMIQLPHSLLTKSGKLTAEERTQLELHVEYARSALEGIDFGVPVIEAITQMHERMDGTGYPLRLFGDDINVDARLLAVASTFCALLRPRSYREARSIEEAITILSSPKYDPYVVHALHTFLKTEQGIKFLKELTPKIA